MKPENLTVRSYKKVLTLGHVIVTITVIIAIYITGVELEIYTKLFTTVTNEDDNSSNYNIN